MVAERKEAIQNEMEHIKCIVVMLFEQLTGMSATGRVVPLVSSL